MFDPQNFIREVQARPILWQPDNKSFHNRIQKGYEWENLAKGFNPNWNKYSERRKKEVVLELQKKWRNLRDYHKKLRRKDKVFKKTSPYLELLSFLDEPDENSSTSMTGHERNVRTDTDDESEYDDEQILNINPEDTACYDHQMTENVVEVVPKQTSDLPNNDPISTEDPDRSFLISILPHIQTMNEEQKFKFKFETMNLINRLKYGSESREKQHDPVLNQRVKPENVDDGTFYDNNCLTIK